MMELMSSWDVWKQRLVGMGWFGEFKNHALIGRYGLPFLTVYHRIAQVWNIERSEA
jgi:hypothetical protein